MTNHYGKNYDKIWEVVGVYLREKGWKGYEGLMGGCFGYVIDPLSGQLHRPDFALIIQGERDQFLNETDPKIKQEWEESSKRIKEITKEVISNECWATFHGKGGWDMERKAALEKFEIGQDYKIIGGREGQSSTYLTFEGIPGNWNSAMFEYDRETAPISRFYDNYKF